MFSVDILDTSQLSFDGEFDDQVLELLQFVRLTAERVQNLQLIFNNLEDTLQQLVPGKLLVFYISGENWHEVFFSIIYLFTAGYECKNLNLENLKF